jgi:hypothetical protein
MSNRKQSLQDPFHPLDNIRQVEAPEFLLTRIQQKIQQKRENNLSPKIAWALAASLLLILSLNIFVLLSHSNKNEAANNWTHGMNLVNDNSFYQ